MRAGKLRHKITIQSYTDTANDFGEVSKGWSDLASVWAFVRPLRGNESYYNKQVAPEMTHEIRMRYRSDIQPNYRINFNSST